MRLRFGAPGVTMSWDDGFPGARASRPHQAWHSLGHLPHLDQPETEPWLSFGWAVVVTADVEAACNAARKLSDHHKEQHAGGTPALPGDKEQYAGETPALPGDKGQNAGGTPALPGEAAPAVRWGQLTKPTRVARGRRRPFGCDAAAPGKGRRPLRAPVRPGRVLPGGRLSGRTA